VRHAVGRLARGLHELRPRRHDRLERLDAGRRDRDGSDDHARPLRFAFVAGLAAALLSACSPLAVLNATVPAAPGVTVLRDIPYGDGPRQKLDVYEPAGGGAGRPLVVFFYGGSWKFGDRADYRFMGLALARQGFVAVVPDYRVFPEAPFPVFLQDAAAAVAYAAAHSAEFGADARPFVMGHSAGGYIALMLALDPAWLAAAGFDRAKLSGAIGLAGPYDFHPPDYPDIAAVFAGSTDEQTQPIRFVDGHAPPLLLLQGEADDTVRPYNARNLVAAVTKAGGTADARFYPDVGHIGLLLAFTTLFESKARALDDAAAFIRERSAAVR
jgi:acetyl esterase/lipase